MVYQRQFDFSRSLEERLWLIRFANFLNRKKVSKNTMKSYVSDLKVLMQECPQNVPLSASLNGVFLRALFQSQTLRQRLSPNTLRRYQMTLRNFARFLQMIDVTRTDFKWLLEETLEIQEKSVRTLQREEYHRLCQQVSVISDSRLQSQRHRRNRLMIRLMGEYALKVHELIELKWGHLSWSDPSLSGLLILGGKRSRQLRLAPDLIQDLIQLQFDRLDLGLNVEQDDYVFYGWNDGIVQNVHEPLNRHGVKFILYQLGMTILGFPISAEVLRTHAILTWFQMGIPLNTIQDWSGLNSVHSLRRFQQVYKTYSPSADSHPSYDQNVDLEK